MQQQGPHMVTRETACFKALQSPQSTTTKTLCAPGALLTATTEPVCHSQSLTPWQKISVLQLRPDTAKDINNKKDWHRKGIYMAHKQEQYECGPINKKRASRQCWLFPVVAFPNARYCLVLSWYLERNPKKLEVLNWGKLDVHFPDVLAKDNIYPCHYFRALRLPREGGV